MKSLKAKFAGVALAVTLLLGSGNVLATTNTPQPGRFFTVGDTIVLDDDTWIIKDDQPGFIEPNRFDGSYKIVGKYLGSYQWHLGSYQWQFETDDNWSFWFGYEDPVALANTPIGFICNGGSGTYDDPYTFELVYQGAMFRLYNPNSGEHFYTSGTAELDNLVTVGWNYEGIGWYAPASSNTPVYRLYNPFGGEHHYTTSVAERDNLVNLGWNYESIGWYSDDNRTIPLYRQYNPNEYANNHNYTTSIEENDYLVSLGWRAEDIGWYGIPLTAAK